MIGRRKEEGLDVDLLDRVELLTVELVRVQAELEGYRQAAQLTDQVSDLKKEIAALKIERSRIQEDHARREREIEGSMTILEEAGDAVEGLRNEEYGTPLENHTRTAEMWSGYLGVPVSPTDVCLMNVLQKVARGRHYTTRDTLVDIAGYARNVEMIWEEVEQRQRVSS